MDSGVTNQVSVKLESTYGTAVVPDASIPIKESDGIKIEQDVIGVEGIKGTAPKNKLFAKGLANYPGSFELDAYPKSLGYFYKSAFGAIADATLEAGVFKHTFSENTSKPGITVEQKIGTITKRFAGFVVESIKLAGKAGEIITASVSGRAKSQADATAISPAYETLRPFNFTDVSALSIGGTDIKSKVDSFEVEYMNALGIFHGMGSVDPQNRFVGQSECKGKLTLYLDNATNAYLTDLINNTEREIILTLTGDVLGSSNNYVLKYTISKCAFKKYETKLGYDYNAVTLEFDAREDSTNGLVKVELTNATTTY